MNTNHLEALRQRFDGPMSSAESEMLCDMQAFIHFPMPNGLSFSFVAATLGHDVNGVLQYGSDLDAASADGFVPKVAGYSKFDADDVGEPEEPIEST